MLTFFPNPTLHQLGLPKGLSVFNPSCIFQKFSKDGFFGNFSKRGFDNLKENEGLGVRGSGKGEGQGRGYCVPARPCT